MTLRDRLRRWWRPAQWGDDHPLDAHERLEARKRGRHWWTEVQNIGGHNAWGRVNVERDFKKKR